MALEPMANGAADSEKCTALLFLILPWENTTQNTKDK